MEELLLPMDAPPMESLCADVEVVEILLVCRVPVPVVGAKGEEGSMEEELDGVDIMDCFFGDLEIRNMKFEI